MTPDPAQLLQKASEGLPPQRPLNALELADRWQIPGNGNSQRITNLLRRCSKCGLKPIPGGRGKTLLFAMPAVLKAENQTNV